MADTVLISLPNEYQNSSASPSSWPGTTTSANFTRHDREHLSGDTKTDNSSKKTLSENVNPGRGGSLYSDSDGFNSTVSTKTTSDFYSKHFIGHKNGNSISSGSSVSDSTESTWLRNVVGFHCEISAIPTGSGSEADGCGTVKQFRICAVYADAGKKVRILEMTSGGTKLSSASYNSSPGQSWSILSYSLSQTDSMKVVNGGWLLYGWVIEMYHKKTCGGGTKTKKCTGRVRYMRPLISGSGSNGLYPNSSKKVLVYHWENTIKTVMEPGAKMLQAV